MRAKQKQAYLTIAVVCSVLVVGTIFYLENYALNDRSPGTGIVSFSGTISMPSQSGAGILNLTIKNTENEAYANIAVSGTTPILTGLVPEAPFVFKGAVVSASNPLPEGASTFGTYEFSSGTTTAASYTVTVQLTLANGTVTTDRMIVTA